MRRVYASAFVISCFLLFCEREDAVLFGVGLCVCVLVCACLCVCVCVLFCGRKADECPMLKCSVLCVLGAFCSSPFIPLRVCSSRAHA